MAQGAARSNRQKSQVAGLNARRGGGTARQAGSASAKAMGNVQQDPRYATLMNSRRGGGNNPRLAKDLKKAYPGASALVGGGGG